MSDYDYMEGLAAGGILIVIALICVALIIVCIVAQWRIFKKAGKPGWHSIIPYLNVYDLYELSWSKNMGIVAIVLSLASSFISGGLEAGGDSSGNEMLATLSGLVGFAYFIISIVQQVKLAKSFGKSGAFAVGLIFLSPIFLCILAFGNASYYGPNGEGRYITPDAYARNNYGQAGAYGQGYGQPAQGGYNTYGQQNIPGGYGSTPAPGYDTFTTASRAPYQGQNGFQAQGQAQQNAYDPQPQPEAQNPFTGGNPYN